MVSRFGTLTKKENKLKLDALVQKAQKTHGPQQ